MDDIFLDNDVELVGTFSDFTYPQHGYMYVSEGISKDVKSILWQMLGSDCNGKAEIQNRFVG